MEILKLAQADWIPEVIRHIQGGFHRTGYCVVESPIVIVYKPNQVDVDKCKDLGYELFELRSNSGTIVSNAGDIGIGHLGDIGNDWCDCFLNYFVKWLQDRGLDAKTEKNDVLVDGYKVCGTCVNRYGRIDYSCGLIGINTKLEDIKQICTKPMVKVPKGLSEFGITTEDIEQMFLDFCAQQDN